MDPAGFILSALLLVAAIALIARANFLFYRILDDVNTTRATHQQISFLFINLRFAQVLSEHRKLFPTDSKSRQMIISLVTGFALLLVFVLVLTLSQFW